MSIFLSYAFYHNMKSNNFLRILYKDTKFIDEQKNENIPVASKLFQINMIAFMTKYNLSITSLFHKLTNLTAKNKRNNR